MLQSGALMAISTALSVLLPGQPTEILLISQSQVSIDIERLHKHVKHTDD